MTWEQIKEIASKRNKSGWPEKPNFTIYMINNFDKIAAVIDSTRELVKHNKEVGGNFWNGGSLKKTEEALEALDKL